jgi:hypothetical protein
MRFRCLIAASVLALAAGCEYRNPVVPSASALVTFRVGSESFRVRVYNEQIDAAYRAAAGSRVRVPNGRIVGGADVNSGWSWHLDDVAFTEATIEVCDGRPSDVERAGVSFGGGRFCPWSAEVATIVLEQ